MSDGRAEIEAAVFVFLRRGIVLRLEGVVGRGLRARSAYEQRAGDGDEGEAPRYHRMLHVMLEMATRGTLLIAGVEPLGSYFGVGMECAQ